jgi:glycosyltransferase involved in cell wall biosynthesis
VVYPLDPMGPKVGGSASFIRGLLQHAPTQIDLRFVGITCNATLRPPLRWRTEQLGARRFEFLPVLHEPQEDIRRWIPLSLRFVLRLRAGMVPDDGAVLVHNRLETVCARGMHERRHIVFIHNDVPAQVGSGPSEVLWSRFPWLYYRFERHVFGYADRVYTVSGNTLAAYRRRFPGAVEKFDFLPTWVDSARFAPAAESKAAIRSRLRARGLELDPQAPWILYVGRLQPQKAPLRLLEAFALTRQQHPSAQLILIGDGNLRSAVEQRIAHLGLAPCTRLLGAIDQAELADYYRAADLLLLASDFEGMPMCVLEALACGLPVVTTRVGEVARVVRPGVTGEIAGRADAQGLSDALCLALGRLPSYTVQACAGTVEPYSPHQVLAPVYARVMALAQQGGAAAPGR